MHEHTKDEACGCGRGGHGQGHGPHGQAHGAHGQGQGRGHGHGLGGHGRGGQFPFGPGGMGFGGMGGQRARRGDIREASLRLLSEQPMHGYQIIQELSARSGGAWSPSAGSVYPTLQLLADEGLITAEETGGKKVFTLTESGVAAAAATAGKPAPWEEAAGVDATGAQGYRETAGKLMHAVFQIGKGGSPAQVAAAIEVLTDARKKLYAILAED